MLLSTQLHRLRKYVVAEKYDAKQRMDDKSAVGASTGQQWQEPPVHINKSAAQRITMRTNGAMSNSRLPLPALAAKCALR